MNTISHATQPATLVVGVVAVLSLLLGGYAAVSLADNGRETDALRQHLGTLDAELQALKSRSANASPTPAAAPDSAPPLPSGSISPFDDLVVRVEDVETRLRELMAAVTRLTGASTDGESAPLPEWFRWNPERAQQLEQLSADVQRLKQQVGELDDSVYRAEQMMREGGRPQGGGGGVFGEENKPSLHRLRAELDLDDGQTAAIEESLRVEKTELLEAMQTTDANGEMMIDRFMRVALDAKMEPAMKQQAVIDLFTRPLPGRSESLMDLHARSGQRVAEVMHRVMTPEQYKKFLAMECPPVDVKLANDPIDEFAKQRLPKILDQLRSDDE